jgi:large subunit ribosomal protein L18
MADKNISKRLLRLKRKTRIRRKITGTETRPRMVVFRSLKHIYIQLVDDQKSHILAALSSLSPQTSERLKESKSKVQTGLIVGEMMGEMAKEKGINRVVFDRNGYLYHGRVKAVADGARKAGLEF